MENLKTSGIYEMNTVEMKEYNGGIGPMALGILVSAGIISTITALVVGLRVSFGGKKKEVKVSRNRIDLDCSVLRY